MEVKKKKYSFKKENINKLLVFLSKEEANEKDSNKESEKNKDKK